MKQLATALATTLTGAALVMWLNNFSGWVFNVDVVAVFPYDIENGTKKQYFLVFYLKVRTFQHCDNKTQFSGHIGIKIADGFQQEMHRYTVKTQQIIQLGTGAVDLKYNQ